MAGVHMAPLTPHRPCLSPAAVASPPGGGGLAGAGEAQRRTARPLPASRHPADGDGGGGGGGASDVPAPRDRGRDRAAAAAPGPAPLDGPLDLPYTPPLPRSYAEFAALVRGRPAPELAAAIARLRAFNAAALAADGKRKLQELLGILVQHFALLAARVPPPAPALDVLAGALGEMAAEVPLYAATVARARIARMADALSAALAGLGGAGARRAAEGAGSVSALLGGAAGGAGSVAPSSASPSASPWPPARSVLQLQLFARLFPASDRRHPVLTPAALLIGKYLSHCVVSSPHDAAVGLCLASLHTALAAPARRSTPEVLAFLRDCLAAFLPHPQQPQPQQQGGGSRQAGSRQADADTFVRFPPGLLALGPHAPAAPAAAAAASSAAAPPLALYELLSLPPSDPRLAGPALRLGLLRAARCGVRRCAQLAAAAGGGGGGGGGPLVCFQQMFEPLAAALRSLAAIEPRLPAELRELRLSVLRQLQDGAAACVAARRPLVNPARARAGSAAAPGGEVRQFNPRFEDGFVSGRDYDPDRTRAEARRLKRALVRERRGAMRELRRDAVFLAEERDAGVAAVDAERRASERRFYAELQRQEADMRSGGQAGMNPHLKQAKKRKT